MEVVRVDVGWRKGIEDKFICELFLLLDLFDFLGVDDDEIMIWEVVIVWGRIFIVL